MSSEEICSALSPLNLTWELLLREEEKELVYKVPTFFLLIVLMVLGLPGNLLVLLVYGFRFPASTTKYFIMAMAAFDLLNCVVGMPFEMIDLKDDMTLNIPAACKVFRFLVTFSACGSVTVLVVISVDRFRRICRPFQKQMTVRQSQKIIGCMASVSLFMSFPALALYGKHTAESHGLAWHDCAIDDNFKDTTLTKAYQFVLSTMSFICIVVLIIMYSFIIFKIHKQRKQRQKLYTHAQTSLLLMNLKIIPNGSSSENERKTMPGNSREDRTCSLNGRTSDTNKCIKFTTSDSNCGIPKNQLSIKSMSRLFSRDVNPVCGEDNDEIDHVTLDEDGISFREERSSEVLSADSSLNNYMSASQDTEIASAETQTPRSAGDTRRTRKMGHSFGRYRPWESAEISRQVSSLSSVKEHECRSVSYSVLEPVADYVPIQSFNIRRASSLPNLLKNEFQLTDNQNRCEVNSTMQCTTPMIYSYDGDHRHSNESYKQMESANDESTSPTQPDNGSAHRHNVTWESLKIREGEKKSSSSSKSDPSQHARSASVATTSNQSNRSQGREIKTSKVSLMMLLVTLGFILSYLPHLAIQLFTALARDRRNRLLCISHAYFTIHHLCLRSFFINNTINPIIYSFYNKTFRQRCLRLLKSPKYLFISSDHPTGASISLDNDTA